MIISYDIETYDLIPGYCPVCEQEGITVKTVDIKDKRVTCPHCGNKDQRYKFMNPYWRKHWPPRITCAGAAYHTAQSQSSNIFMGKEKEPMTKEETNEMIDTLITWQDAGHQIISWNGVHFDFRVLADLTKRYEEVTELCLNSIDLMFYVFCARGFRLGLDTTCKGMGIEGKLHEVTLKDGTVVNDIDGADAPDFWKRGETEAVITYLREDVRSLARLANEIKKRKQITWISNSGRRNFIPMADLFTVEQCMHIPEPDTSWMKGEAPNRLEMYDWMAHVRPGGPDGRSS